MRGEYRNGKQESCQSFLVSFAESVDGAPFRMAN
jgi:hypothetical protein